MEMAEEGEEPMAKEMTEETTTTTKKKTRPKPETKLPITEEELTTLFSLIASATSLSHSFLSQNDLLLLPSQTLTLESSIKSTALSLSCLLSLQTLNPPPLPPPPCPFVSWFHRLFSSSDSDSDARFNESFHLSKPSFHLLLQTLSPSLQAPPELSLAATLFRLSHTAPTTPSRAASALTPQPPAAPSTRSARPSSTATPISLICRLLPGTFLFHCYEEHFGLPKWEEKVKWVTFQSAGRKKKRKENDK